MSSEADFSKSFIRSLDGGYYFHRVETRFSGLPDISYLSRITGKGGWIETKFVPTRSLKGLIKIPIITDQAIFLRKWASTHPDARAFVFFSVMDKDFYFFRAKPEVLWVTAIREPLDMSNLAYLNPLICKGEVDYRALIEFMGQ